MEVTGTNDFGFSDQLTTLKEMESLGILNNPEEKFVVLIFGRQGLAHLHINLKNQVMQAGSITTLLPDFHIDIDDEKGFLCNYIYFTFDFMAEFPLILKPKGAEKISKKPCIDLTEQEQENLTRFYALLKQQYQRAYHPSRLEIVKSVLFIINAEIYMIYSEQIVNLTSTYTEQLTWQFFQLLHDYALTEHKPAFYAAKMCLTVRYLSKALKQETGKPLNRWVSDFSIHVAKKLLKSTSMTSAEIAEVMKFPNPSFFSKFFKKHTGMTPLQFKKQ